MARNTYTRVIGRIFLSVHTRQPPTDEEWEASISQVSAGTEAHGKMCTLVFTDGGAPNGAQRKRLQQALQGRDMQTAVLSGALVPRFVNASIALFVKSIRSFTPEELPQAREFLQITDQEMKQIKAALLEIKEELKPEKVAALERALQ